MSFTKLRLPLLVLSLLSGRLLGGNIAADQSDMPPHWQSGRSTDFQLVPERTIKSTDGKISIQEYIRFSENGFGDWKISVTYEGETHDLPTLTEEDGLPNAYPGYFIISADDQMLIRFQKMGSGESGIYLYLRKANQFVPDSDVPLAR